MQNGDLRRIVPRDFYGAAGDGAEGRGGCHRVWKRHVPGGFMTQPVSQPASHQPDASQLVPLCKPRMAPRAPMSVSQPASQPGPWV